MAGEATEAVEATMLCIHVVPEPGDEIRKTSHEAQMIADQLSVKVQFEFNGVTCVAYPCGDYRELAKRQQQEQARKQEVPMRPRIATNKPD